MGEATTLTLGYEHFQDERVADRGIPSNPTATNGRRLPVDTHPSTFFGDPERSPTSSDVDALNALVEHDFGNGLSLRNRTRIADYEKFYQNVFAGAVNPAATQVSISAYNSPSSRRNLLNQTDFVWSLDGTIRQTVLVGAEFGRQTSDNFRNTGYFGAPGSTTTSVLVPLSNPRYTGPLEFRQSATDADNHVVASRSPK